MDITAILNESTKEVLGYGVLGVAVIVLAILFWVERRDRKAADAMVDTVRDDAADKIAALQEARINELRAAIDATREGQELMKAMQAEVTGVRDSIKMLANALGGSR